MQLLMVLSSLHAQYLKQQIKATEDVEEFPPKKSMMRPWMPTVQSIQELACSKAHSIDTVQLSDATSLCDTGSNLRSRRALQTTHIRVRARVMYILTC